MKRRLLSLLLCTIMVVQSALVLISCTGDKGMSDATGTIRPMTVTIAMITDGSTTDASVSAAQDALNQITESTYNTHVVLKLYTEDEYEDAIAGMMKARYEDQFGSEIFTSIGDGNEVELNEFGREQTVYPDTYENQIDIFLCTSFEMYRSYLQYVYVNEDGTKDEPTIALSELQQYIDEGKGQLLSKYYSDSVLYYGKHDFRDGSNKDVYALPSNGIPTGYEYLLINKKLFDEGKYDIENVRDNFATDDISTISDYLVDLAENEKTTGIVPLYNVTDMGVYSLTGSHSVLGQFMNASYCSPRKGFHPSNILQVQTVRDTLTLFNDIRVAGGTYPVHTDSVDFSKKFGACYVSGSCDIYEASKESGVYTIDGTEYYVILSGEPYFDTADITDNMWAISAYTSDAERCMEVLTLLNTNAQARNILLYGVENVSYFIDEDTGLVNRYTDTAVSLNYYTKDGKKVFNADGSYAIDLEKNPRRTWVEGKEYDVVCNYKMDMYKTGNLYLVWPNSDMTEEELAMSADNWALAKKALHDGFISPYTGVAVPNVTETAEGMITSQQINENLAKLYDEVFVRAQQYDTYVDPDTGAKVSFGDYLNVLKKWIDSDEYFKAATGTGATSIRQAYVSYFEGYFYVAE